MNIHNTLIKCAVLLLGGAAIFASCTDLSGIEERIDSLDSRVTALENQVSSFNESLTAINGLIKDGTVITGITETENGYTFTASNGETYTITNGTAGNTPLVRIDAEGNWEVSYDDGDSYDDIMVDENTPASAQGIAPQFQVSDDGYWQVSTDGGKTFSDVHYAGTEDKVPAVGESGTSWFKDVEYDEEAGTLTITLANSGTPLVIPVVSDFSCIIYDGQNPVDYNTAQIFSAGEQKEYSVRTTGVVSAKLSTPQGWKASLSDINETGEATLTVTAPASASADALTKVTADTEKDITIHALNKDGLSLFAKMQVEAVFGPVPSISLSAGDATFNTLTFNVTPNENVTSYKYLLYKSGTKVPTDETSFADAQEVMDNLSAPLTLDQDAAGASLDFDTEYTLYVLPVNTGEETSYGRIASATASTTVPATNSELYEATGSITIAGVTYDHDTYGDATVYETGSEITEAPSTTINFIEDGVSMNFSSATTNLIFIGNNPNVRSEFTLKNYFRLAPSDGNDKFVLANLEVLYESYTSGYYTSITSTGTFEYICIDNCGFNVSKNILGITTDDVGTFSEIIISDSDFEVPSGNTQRYIIGTNSHTRTADKVTVNNNIFYCDPSGCNNFRLLFLPGMDLTSFTMNNNTFYNLEGASNTDFYNRLNSLNEFNANYNIIYNDVILNGKNLSLLNCMTTYPATGTASNNLAYSNSEYKCNLLYSGADYTETIVNTTKPETDPLSVKDTENGIFTPTSEYSSYGAQR